MNDVVISSGHGLYVSGAVGIIDEVKEARRVVKRVTEYMRQLGVRVTEYHDNVSKTQTKNVNGIVAYHNTIIRKTDVSVHFNANRKTTKPVGVEVLYLTEQKLASDVSKAISDVSGLKNRGAKKRTNLGFLNRTKMPAILIEVCFVDSEEDVRLYQKNFDAICKAIAESIVGKKISELPKTQKYRILTGTFNSEAKAEQGLENLKAIGACSVGYVKKDGDKFRVLTGTYPNKEAVDNVVKSIKAHYGYVLYVKEA